MSEYNVGTKALAAKAAHDANFHYNKFRGIDRDGKLWEDCSDEEKHRLLNAAGRIFDNPKLTPEELHKLWCEDMLSRGWKYGDAYSFADKTHPCIASYNEIPDEDKLKDTMYLSIIRAFCVL